MNRTTLHLLGTPHVPLATGEAEQTPPTRIRVLAWGVNESTKGNFTVGPVTVQALSANQRRYGFDRIALDFNHNTVPGTPAFLEAKEPRPVAAYGRAEVVEGEGLFVTDLSWTPDGLANWRNYSDVSATPARDEQGNVIFLHSAAICRQGAVPGMELVAASVELKELPPVVALDAASMAAVVDAVGNQLRDAEWRKRELQDLQEDALNREMQRNATLNTALEAVTAQLAALKAELESYRAGAAPMTALTALTAEFATLRTAQASSEDRHARELLMLTARTQGKLIPLSADGLASIPLANLRELVANAKPGEVPLGRLTPLSAPPFPDASADDGARAARISARAKQIQQANPRQSWSRCWAEASAVA